MTPEQALNNLYQAARLAPLNAEQHDVVLKSAQALSEIIKPKETPKKDK